MKSVSGRVVLGGCVDSTLPSLHFNNVKSRELELLEVPVRLQVLKLVPSTRETMFLTGKLGNHFYI